MVKKLAHSDRLIVKVGLAYCIFLKKAFSLCGFLYQLNYPVYNQQTVKSVSRQSDVAVPLKT